eukprot:Opistho-2@70159
MPTHSRAGAFMSRCLGLFVRGDGRGRRAYLRPLASEVLTVHLRTLRPDCTSFYIPYHAAINDQFGRSRFNWNVDSRNYDILRMGCFPFVKYHCTHTSAPVDSTVDDAVFRVVKMVNFGIPTLAYGIGSLLLLKRSDTVQTSKGAVKIYFLYDENGNGVY